MFVYRQRTGQFLEDGILLATGYSGAGEGKNNPLLEHVRNVGPIPCGEYEIGEAFSSRTKGPVVMRLIPAGHKARNRSGFLIHGDNKTHTASRGCIILDRKTREHVSNVRGRLSVEPGEEGTP